MYIMTLGDWNVPTHFTVLKLPSMVRAKIILGYNLGDLRGNLGNLRRIVGERQKLQEFPFTMLISPLWVSPKYESAVFGRSQCEGFSMELGV